MVTTLATSPLNLHLDLLDATHDAENVAMNMAAQMFNFIDIPEKPCHCKCKLYDGSPCIRQYQVIYMYMYM